MPRASLRSVLLICACNTARMCRVSTQITGSHASASALKSHCDSGPASSPIRLKRCDAALYITKLPKAEHDAEQTHVGQPPLNGSTSPIDTDDSDAGKDDPTNEPTNKNHCQFSPQCCIWRAILRRSLKLN